MKKEKRSISFSDWWAFQECPLAWYMIKYLRKKTPDSLPQVIGNAVDAIANHGYDMSAAAPAVEAELAKLGAEEAAAARLVIAEHAAAAEALEEDDDEDNATRQPKYVWVDAKTGWKFVAKPDKVIVTEQGRRTIVQIIDNKTSRFLKRKHKEQMWFFAMVVVRALHEKGELDMSKLRNGDVQLLVRLSGEQHEDEAGQEEQGIERRVGYLSFKEPELLDKVRATIDLMERYFAEKNFPGKPGWYCERCPLAATCKAHADYQVQVTGNQSLPVLPAREARTA